MISDLFHANEIVETINFVFCPVTVIVCHVHFSIDIEVVRLVEVDEFRVDVIFWQSTCQTVYTKCFRIL